MPHGSDPYDLHDAGYAGINAGLGRRALRPNGGTSMRLDLSSVAYTLIFAGIAVWATSKLIRA